MLATGVASGVAILAAAAGLGQVVPGGVATETDFGGAGVAGRSRRSCFGGRIGLLFTEASRGSTLLYTCFATVFGLPSEDSFRLPIVEMPVDLYDTATGILMGWDTGVSVPISR